jgi:AcrR family transcriptional regulator
MKKPSNPAPVKQLRLPRAEREQQILEVAIGLFISRGYQGTSIEDLAQAAGVTRPIIYNLFGSKDNIYLACLRRARENLNACIAEAVSAKVTVEDRLRAGIDGYFRFVEQDRAAWRLLFDEGAAIAGSAAAAARKLRFDTVRRITDLLAATMPHVPRSLLEMQGHAVSGAGEQLAKWWVGRKDVDRATVVDVMMSLMWNGFSAQGMPPAAVPSRRRR